MKILQFTTLVLLLQWVQNRIVEKCDTPQLQEDFNVTKYGGLWYENFRDKDFYWEKDATCVTAEYALNEDGTVEVYNSQISPSSSERESQEGSAICEGANCKVKFFLTYSGDYRVVSTDYANYALVYSCSDILIGKTLNVWILSRTYSLDEATLTTIRGIASKELPNYDQTWLSQTAQGDNCNYERALPSANEFEQ